jgi:hypothetical protein
MSFWVCILTVRSEPRSDFQALGVFNCPAIERRSRFCGQSRCDDKGDKRADGAQKHCRNEGGKGGVIRERQSRAASASERTEEHPATRRLTRHGWWERFS